MSVMQHHFIPGRDDQEELASFLRAAESLLSVRVNEKYGAYDFLTVAGEAPSHSEFGALGAFSCTYNWNVCYAYDPSGGNRVFDPAKMRFLCVFSTGDDFPIFLNGGRLWVDGNCGRLAIAFSDERLHLKLNVDKRGNLAVRQSIYPFSPRGYEKAVQLLRCRQAVETGKAAVFTALGAVPCTMDIRMLQRARNAPK